MRRRVAALVVLVTLLLTVLLTVAAAHSAGHTRCETEYGDSHGRILDPHAPGWSHSMIKYWDGPYRWSTYDVVKRHYERVGPPSGRYWQWQHSSATTGCRDWNP